MASKRVRLVFDTGATRRAITAQRTMMMVTQRTKASRLRPGQLSRLHFDWGVAMARSTRRLLAPEGPGGSDGRQGGGLQTSLYRAKQSEIGEA